MQILTIDFETYYSTTFSLSHMTVEEYVRSHEFEVIGVSVKINDADSVWFSGSMLDIQKWLEQFDWANSLALAHNAMFDAAILNWCFDIKPKGWLDTLSMGRALHGTEVGGSLKVLAEHYKLGVKGTEVENAKGLRLADFSPDHLARYGEYCRNDVDLTYKLFGAMSADFPSVELRLIDVTIRMFSEPVLELDYGKLNVHLHNVRQKKADLLNKALIDKDDLMSNPKLAVALKELGVEPPMKISPTTGKETFAFAKNDEAFKALLEHENPVVQAIVAARLGVKSTLEETRTERFIDISNRGTLPVPLRYYAAHTGRWGGDDKLNLQNLPRKSPLKQAIRAPKGMMLIDSDSSQIEARTLAWLAGQEDLVNVFTLNNQEIASGVPKKDMKYDPYKIMAAAIYGKAPYAITEEERFVGKQTVLGAGYGMGAAKFKAQLKTFGVDIPLEECQRIISTYRSTYPRIPELWTIAGTALKAVLQNSYFEFGRDNLLKVEGRKGIKLPNGLHIKYPNIRLAETDGKVEVVYDTYRGKQKVPNRIYGGKVIENVCQALARIIIGEQMLRIAKKYKVVMTVHDAIACVVPEHEVETGVEFVQLCMQLRPQWGLELPLNCEAGYGRSYAEC